MYVAVKGGERAIANAHALLAEKRRGDRSVAEIDGVRSTNNSSLAVDRVMSEASLYDRQIAALAIKQARGDLIEAVFLARAYRTTLPRFGFAEPLDTGGDGACAPRLGHLQGSAGRPGARADLRLHAPAARLRAGRTPPIRLQPATVAAEPRCRAARRRHHRRRRPDREEPAGGGRRVRSPTSPAIRPNSPLPATRGCKSWRAATKAFCSASAIRPSAATAATIRSSAKSASARSRSRCSSPELGFAVALGDDRSDRMPDGQSVQRRRRRAAAVHPRLRPGVRPERAQGDVDGAGRSRLARRRARRTEVGPAQDEEFVLSHSDNVQATGFVEHLKLPHYVDFQAELALLRQLRREASASSPDAEAAE